MIYCCLNLFGNLSFPFSGHRCGAKLTARMSGLRHIAFL
jgi:hypothetical protein